MAESEIQKLTSQLEGNEGEKGVQAARNRLAEMTPQQEYEASRKIQEENAKHLAERPLAHFPKLTFEGNGDINVQAFDKNTNQYGKPSKIVDEEILQKASKLTKLCEGRKFDDLDHEMKDIKDPVKAFKIAMEMKKQMEEHKEKNPNADQPQLIVKGVGDLAWDDKQGPHKDKGLMIAIHDDAKLDWERSHFGADKELCRFSKLTSEQLQQMAEAYGQKPVPAGADLVQAMNLAQSAVNNIMNEWVDRTF